MADSTGSKVDIYGFERPDDFDYATYEEFISKYLGVLARRASKWQVLIGDKNSIEKSRKLKRYIRKGIPAEHRSMVWMYMSGAQQRMNEQPNLYQSLLQQQHDPYVVECISKDIPRTFPENIYFADTQDPNGKRKPLTNVLLALAAKYPNIGYCQGLNFIGGLLLVIIKDEHKVFWLMDHIITLAPEYYTADMMGTKVDQEVLRELVRQKVPDVQKLMDRENVEWPLISAKWFLCFYADVLPVETVLRIWDCLFAEGGKIMFRVAITMVKVNKDRLLRCRNFPEIINVAKALPSDAQMVHCHEFMEKIFKEPGLLSRSNIEKLREVCRLRVQENAPKPNPS